MDEWLNLMIPGQAPMVVNTTIVKKKKFKKSTPLENI